MNKKSRLSITRRFGEAVRRRRQKSGISQEELAEYAGLHRTYVSDIERGKRNISLENIEKIAKALGISMADLFSNWKNKADE